MHFTVIPYPDRAKKYKNITGQSEAFLIRDNWDDYGFKTSFSLIYFTDMGERFDLGEVKIMQSGMTGGYTPMEEEFQALGPDYASLGQGQEFYENLLVLEDDIRFDVLAALRDVIWDPVIREAVVDEQAYGTSLMRGVGEARFKKFVDIVHHDPVLTPLTSPINFRTFQRKSSSKSHRTVCRRLIYTS